MKLKSSDLILKRCLTVLSFCGILTGAGLLSIHVIEALHFSVIPATISSFEQSVGACRRRTGKIEECRHFDVTVSYSPYAARADASKDSRGLPASDSQKLTAVVTTEAKRLDPKVGDEIKVFINRDNPADVRVNLLRDGWKTPLSILSLSTLIFAILRLSRKRS